MHRRLEEQEMKNNFGKAHNEVTGKNTRRNKVIGREELKIETKLSRSEEKHVSFDDLTLEKKVEEFAASEFKEVIRQEPEKVKGEDLKGENEIRKDKHARWVNRLLIGDFVHPGIEKIKKEEKVNMEEAIRIFDERKEKRRMERQIKHGEADASAGKEKRNICDKCGINANLKCSKCHKTF